MSERAATQGGWSLARPRRDDGAVRLRRRSGGAACMAADSASQRGIRMDFVKRTIDLAMRNVEEGGRPFATVIVRDGEIVADSPNRVAQTCDPTAHAEILAIREACRTLGTEHLTDCDIYILASPCPMCLGSLYYCSPRQVIYVTTREDYAPFYRDDRKYFELD